jgi:hypothetical protein
MSNKEMDYELASEIVADIEARVGRVGHESVTTSKHGERFGSVALSRGGIVTPIDSYQENYEARRRAHVYRGGDKKGKLMYSDAPEPTQPFFHGDLAIVNHNVGTDDEDGLHGREHTTLSSEDSHEYVFLQVGDGLWRAFDAFSNASSNYWTKTTEYFLDASRPVETDEEGLAIRGLIATFDAALIERAEDAVAAETGLIPQDQWPERT